MREGIKEYETKRFYLEIEIEIHTRMHAYIYIYIHTYVHRCTDVWRKHRHIQRLDTAQAISSSDNTFYIDRLIRQKKEARKKESFLHLISHIYFSD